MAGFKTHITTSTTLGVAYATYGAFHGVPIEAAAIAGGLCSLGGMLPDIDSDSGVPVRETMGFAAAITPLLLIDRFHHLGFSYDQMVLAGALSYLFVRFGIAGLLKRYTVHRGMFHSIPALLLFTGIYFLICGSINLELRYFKAGGVFLGVLSHLVLDEIWSVEWQGGRWRFKSSFGTALKLWGGDPWSNISTYAKLAVVAALILSEPAVMERYGKLSPVVLDIEAWRQRLGLSDNEPLPASASWPQYAANPYDAAPIGPWDTAKPNLAGAAPAANQFPQRDHDIYDTARRFWNRLRQ